jgi:hypothetical protein
MPAASAERLAPGVARPKDLAVLPVLQATLETVAKTLKVVEQVACRASFIRIVSRICIGVVSFDLLAR